MIYLAFIPLILALFFLPIPIYLKGKVYQNLDKPIFAQIKIAFIPIGKIYASVKDGNLVFDGSVNEEIPINQLFNKDNDNKSLFNLLKLRRWSNTIYLDFDKTTTSLIAMQSSIGQLLPKTRLTIDFAFRLDERLAQIDLVLTTSIFKIIKVAIFGG